MRALARVVVLVLFEMVVGCAGVWGQGASSLLTDERSVLPSPPGLRPQVEFWKNVFGTYSTRQVVIHDTLALDRVYAVLDFREFAADSGATEIEVEEYMDDRVRQEKERVRTTLVRLSSHDGGPESLTPDERTIWALFSGVKEPNKFLAAAADDRIRAQRGLRERFATGVSVSRRYLPEMESIFRREGLPLSLTRLPLVESCFNVRAYSKVGAAGIWQFMPATGRLYMRVDRAVDERRDPIRATEAAARHLRRDFEALGTWPLAVTAYNHGRAGMLRAVETTGTMDLTEIVRHYEGPAFRFASRNFYAEFLAALEVEQNFKHYFGPVHGAVRPNVGEVMVPKAVNFSILARAAAVDSDTLADLNPALTPDVVSNRVRVPRGYRARVPVDAAADVSVRLVELVSMKAPTVRRQRPNGAHAVTHRVRPGQTLTEIAKHYRTSVALIQRRNKIRSGSRLRAGQQLVIPRG